MIRYFINKTPEYFLIVMFAIVLSIRYFSVAKFSVSRVGLISTGFVPRLCNELMNWFICELMSF